MIKTVSIIYFKKFLRLLADIGLVRVMLLTIIALLFTLPIFFRFSTNPLLPTVLTFAVILSIHIQRNDKRFLLILLGDAKRLYLVHYHFISLPIYIILLSLSKFILFAFLLLAVSVVPVLITKNYSVNNLSDLIRNIPIRNFELKSGLRRNLLIIPGLYFVSIAFYKYPNIALVSILVFTFVSTSFYNESEPRQMLEVFQKSAKKFLLSKISNQLVDFFAISLPFIAVYLFSNLEYWYILVVFLIISFIIQTLGICLKYAFYEPGKDINKNIFMAVYALGLFVPFFVPVPLVMMIHYFRKAVSNLNNYLYDYY